MSQCSYRAEIRTGGNYELQFGIIKLSTQNQSNKISFSCWTWHSELHGLHEIIVLSTQPHFSVFALFDSLFQLHALALVGKKGYYMCNTLIRYYFASSAASNGLSISTEEGWRILRAK